MGANLSDLEVGDDVVVDDSNVDVIFDMHQNQVEWNRGMPECLSGPCRVIQAIETDAVIRGPSGNVYRIDSNLLTKYEEPENIEIGKIVEVIENRRLFEILQIGHGEMKEGITDMLGQQVLVTAKDENGDYIVQHKDKSYTVNVRCLINDVIPSGIVKGDKVKLIGDLVEMKFLQENHGGWCSLMEIFLNQEVEIVDISDDGDCIVSKYGMEWIINSKCIESENKRYKRSERLKKGEIVRILDPSFNVGNLGKKKAKVEKQFSNGTVKITVDGNSVVVNRMFLSKQISTNEINPSDNISSGDFVKLITDKNKVRELQKGHGEWIPGMSKLLGCEGKVISVLANGDLRVKVKSFNKKLTLNRNCVVKVDADNEVQSNNNQILSSIDTIDSEIGSDSEDSLEIHQLNLSKFPIFEDVTQVSNHVDDIEPNEAVSDVNPLATSVKQSNSEILKLLLEKGAEVNAMDKFGNTALHLACEKHDIEMVNLLLLNGADVNFENIEKTTPIIIAAKLGFVNVLRALIEKNGADINARDIDLNTALHHAVRNGNAECVEILLDHGADIKIVNDRKKTAFHLAVTKNQERILQIILDRTGVSIVDLQTEDKLAAIHMATLHNFFGCLKILIEHKADINIRNADMSTALHLAVSLKNLNCIQLLVENNAELNLKDNDLDTPLHIAVKLHQLHYMFQNFADSFDSSETEEIIRYLIEKGSKINLVNQLGYTPRDLCSDSRLLQFMENSQEEETYKTDSETEADSTADKLMEGNIEEIRRVVKEMEDKKTCGNCRDRNVSVTFGCGHMSCDTCANNSLECYFCGVPIMKKIRIFE